MNADECHRVNEIYKLKWAGERDADEYRKKVAKERRDNSDSLIAIDKEILAAAEKLAKKEQSHAEIEKRLKESEALSTRAMKNLSEKQRIIQEQANLIMENKRRVELMYQVLKIRQFSWLQKSSIRKRGLMQRWLKGLMILRRYQLKLQMTSVKKEEFRNKCITATLLFLFFY